MDSKDFILASGSAQRIALLRQVGYEPKKIYPADVDERCLPHENALPYVRRMALNKALKVAEEFKEENILACDTIVVVGNRIIHKAENAEQQRLHMKLLSGRNHRVISSVCLVSKNGTISQRTVSTKIAMQQLSNKDIDDYIKSNEWQGVCGYKIEGKMAGFITKIIGSYSGVVGLPLNATLNLLKGVGIR